MSQNITQDKFWTMSRVYVLLVYVLLSCIMVILVYLCIFMYYQRFMNYFLIYILRQNFWKYNRRNFSTVSSLYVLNFFKYFGCLKILNYIILYVLNWFKYFGTKCLKKSDKKNFELHQVFMCQIDLSILGQNVSKSQTKTFLNYIKSLCGKLI